MMRRILAFSLILALLAICTMPLATALGAPDDERTLLKYPLPGSLSCYGFDNGGCADAILDWGKVHTCDITDVYNGCCCCLQYGVSEGTGYVNVGNCPIHNFDVGYVLADAKGKLTVGIDEASVYLKNSEAAPALSISAGDVLSLLNGVVLSGDLTIGGNYSFSVLGFPVNIPYKATVPFTLDLGTGAFKLNTSDIEIMILDATLSKYLSSVTSYLAGLFSGLELPSLYDMTDLSKLTFSFPLSDLLNFRNPIKFSASRAFDVPYSFGYAYNGSLVNGTQSTINTSGLMADPACWLGKLNQGFDLNELFGKEDVTLGDLAQKLNALTGGKLDELGGWVQSNLLSGVLDQLAQKAVDAITPSLSGVMNGINVSGYIPGASLSVGFDAKAKDRLLSNLRTLVSDKLSEWTGVILNNVCVSFSASSEFDPGTVKHILLTGVTQTNKEFSLSDTNRTIKVGGAAQLSPVLNPSNTDAYVGPYTYTILQGSDVVKVDADGSVKGLKAGTAIVEIATTVSCNIECAGMEGCCCTLPVSTTVTITVNSDTVTKQETGSKTNNTADDNGNTGDDSGEVTGGVTDDTIDGPTGGDTGEDAGTVETVPEPEDVIPISQPEVNPPPADAPAKKSPTNGPAMPYTGGFWFGPLAILLGIGCITTGIVVKRKLVK